MRISQHKDCFSRDEEEDGYERIYIYIYIYRKRDVDRFGH